MNTFKKIGFVVAVLTVAGWTGIAHAANYGVVISGQDWSSASTWTPSGPPGAADNAAIGGALVGGQLLTATVSLTSGVQTVDGVYMGINSTSANGTLTVSGGTLTNNLMSIGHDGTGTVTQTAGTVFVKPGASSVRISNLNNARGTYNLNGDSARLIVSSDVYLAVGTGGGTFGTGTVAITSGNMSVGGDFYSGFTGVGIVNQSGGTNTVKGTVKLGQLAGATGIYNLSGGMLNATTLSTNGNVNSALNFTGGTLSVNTINSVVVNDGGTLAPGQTNTTGKTQINGTYSVNTSSLTAKLALQLGGTGQGTTYDWLSVSGTASLDGLLDVSRVNAFTPLFANTFTVVTAGTITGVFDNAPVSGQRYELSVGNTFIVTYNAGSVVLSDYQFYAPEPSVVMLFGLGGLLLWKRQRS
jgi:hypothetical protein